MTVSTVISALSLALLASSISMLLEFCFRYGNIFDFWLPWVAKKWLGDNSYPIVTPTLYAHEYSETYPTLQEAQYYVVLDYVADKWKWIKPLGYCVICLNVWVTLIFTLPLMPTFYGLILTVGISHLLTRAYVKLL